MSACRKLVSTLLCTALPSRRELPFWGLFVDSTHNGNARAVRLDVVRDAVADDAGARHHLEGRIYLRALCT